MPTFFGVTAFVSDFAGILPPCVLLVRSIMQIHVVAGHVRCPNATSFLPFFLGFLVSVTLMRTTDENEAETEAMVGRAVVTELEDLPVHTSTHNSGNSDTVSLISRTPPSVGDIRDDAVTDVIGLTPDINVLPAQIGYFGHFFSGAAISAFFGVIFTEKGMSAQGVGILLSSMPFASMLLLPVVMYLADRFRCTRGIVVICSILSTIAVVIFIYVSSSTAVLISFLVWVLTETPINPLLDQHTLSMFPKESRVEKWGALRSLGAYGWGIGNPFVALLVDLLGGWGIAAVQYCIGQLSLLYCMFETHPYNMVEQTPMQFHEVFVFLMQRRRLLLFLVASCLMGMGYTVVSNFLFIFIDSIGGSKLLMGLSLTLTVSTEIPIFQRAKDIHRIFTDRQLLSIAMFTWSIRVTGYSFLQNPWMLLLLEPLHGITFGFMWLPGTHLVNSVFPPHLANSATGFLYLFVNGIGPIIGSIISGCLYEMFGPRIMFRLSALAMFCGMVMFVVVDCILERRELAKTGVDSLLPHSEEAEHDSRPIGSNECELGVVSQPG
ncbi:hypothetical protein TRVL_04246 [Trypanosoma vivax]|uniref:Major facilitator superfamily (MFS) profile domain-containing protein n=1 Tax=Trypanosoma vivax (strain Y486) TaxID=1055687 RepID=G0U8A1_TRYVY|nr:hypothetical protein TRVL_04246 [Trypanosoma vivax]CCC52111.1 conserved hypothetical protein [Trypanosoma vivax Y486]